MMRSTLECVLLKASKLYLVGNREAGRSFHILAVHIRDVEEKRFMSFHEHIIIDALPVGVFAIGLSKLLTLKASFLSLQ